MDSQVNACEIKLRIHKWKKKKGRVSWCFWPSHLFEYNFWCTNFLCPWRLDWGSKLSLWAVAGFAFLDCLSWNFGRSQSAFKCLCSSSRLLHCIQISLIKYSFCFIAQRVWIASSSYSSYEFIRISKATKALLILKVNHICTLMHY